MVITPSSSDQTAIIFAQVGLGEGRAEGGFASPGR